HLSRRRSHLVIQLVAWVARGLVWFTRRILWCLMWVGHAVSSMMSRQMEYDADRYLCRLVGSETTQRMLDHLPCIDLAAAAAFSDVNAAWREQRLHDDLPALIAA